MSSEQSREVGGEDGDKIEHLRTHGAPRGGADLNDAMEATSKTEPSTPGTVPGATRERVLSTNEFERLLIGASRTPTTQGSPNADLEARAAILIAGRLGLRRGELAHLDASWVNTDTQMLHIPAHDPCDSGRNGSLCGYCRQAVAQMEDNRDDPDRDELESMYWRPKTEASVRSIPYASISSRVTFAVEWLLDEDGGWAYSSSTLKRRVEDAAEHAPDLTTNVTLHGLRGTAATYHAGNGVDWQALKTMMGWRENDTPKQYLAIDGAMTKKALREVYS